MEPRGSVIKMLQIEIGAIDVNFWEQGDIKNFLQFVKGYSFLQEKELLTYFSKIKPLTYIKVSAGGNLRFLMIGQQIRYNKLMTLLISEHQGGLVYFSKDFSDKDILLLKRRLRMQGFMQLFYSSTTLKENVDLGFIHKFKSLLAKQNIIFSVNFTKGTSELLATSKSADLRRLIKNKTFKILGFTEKSLDVSIFIQEFCDIENSTMTKITSMESLRKYLPSLLESKCSSLEWNGYLAKLDDGRCIASVLFLNDTSLGVSYYFYSNYNQSFYKSGAVDCIIHDHIQLCCASSRIRTVSLMPSGDRSNVFHYKKSWANHWDIVNTFFIPLSFRAKIIWFILIAKKLFLNKS